MKAFFSRKVPFYVLAADEVTDSIGFDAYPIEVNEATLSYAQQARAVVLDMEQLFKDNPTAEECAQEEADTFAQLII
jgi:hypothetical protein